MHMEVDARMNDKTKAPKQEERQVPITRKFQIQKLKKIMNSDAGGMMSYTYALCIALSQNNN